MKALAFVLQIQENHAPNQAIAFMNAGAMDNAPVGRQAIAPGGFQQIPHVRRRDPCPVRQSDNFYIV